MVKWFSVVKKKTVSLAFGLPPSARTLQTFTLCLADPNALDALFSMIFSGTENKYDVQIEESAVIRSLYADEEVLGKELCLIIDIALAKVAQRLS